MIQINPLKSYIDGGVRAALTTPPSASLVFDLPGKAIWVKGVKLKGTDHTYIFNHDNYITLTNTPDKNNPESEDIKIGVNITTLKNVIDTTYNGGTLALLQEGLNTEERTWLAKILHSYINDVLPTTKNLKINGTNYAIYTTENSLPLFFVPTSLGTTGQILACTSSGLIWIDLIQNTDYRVSLSSATSNSDYRIILKQGANNNPETDFVRFSEYLTFNPYTKILKINNIKVVTATDIYTGSTAGLVPTATSAQLRYYLRGDGTWVSIATEMATANTWRPIKVGNTDALGSGTNTGTLSFIAGTGITLSWDATNKRIIITNSSPDINHNTDETVRQVPKTDNVNRPLMMINGSTSAGEQINTSMFSTGIYANASTKMITANGFIKAGSSNNYVLLGGGSHKALSDFAMASNYVKKTGDTMTGPLQLNGSPSQSNPPLQINYTSNFEPSDLTIGLLKFGKLTTHDMYLGISPTTRTHFGRVGYFMHVNNNCEFTWASSGWTNLMALTGGTGNLWVKGSITAGNFIKSGSSDSYVLLGGGGHKLVSDFATSGHTHDGRYLRWNGSAADISAMGWGTLTAANGYTILSHASSSDGGDVGFVNKNGQIFMLLDGYYYLNEGRYRVLDTSDFTEFSNIGSLTTRITIGGVIKDLKIDADLLDGLHGSRYTCALGSPNYITINVGGDANTYYPVVISNVSDFYPMLFVNISRTYYETAPDTWNTSTHKGGLTLTLLWNGSRYWDGNSSGAACYCVYKTESYSTMVGGLGNAVGGKVVWLRGGGAVYHIHSMNGTSTSVTVYTSTYTDNANHSFAPKTTPEVISVRWPGYTQGADYATSAGNADTVDGLHYSSFLRKDTNDSTPYQYTFTKTNDHAIRVGTVRGTAVGSQTGDYIHLYERVAIGSPSGWGSRPAPSYGLATYGGAWLATDTGSVGIGTTSPSQKLHVNGSVYLGKTDLDNTPFTDSLQILANSSNESYNENFNESNQSFGITFIRDWATGGYRTKQGGIYSVGSGGWRAGLAFRVKNNTTGNGTHDITAMWISPAGNVGIGTTTPAYKLHVNGTLGVTDITTFNINNLWLTPSVLQIGRPDSSGDLSKAIIGVTNGNLHIDSYAGYDIYLNHYNKGKVRFGYQSGSYYISEDGSYYNGTATKAKYPVGFTSHGTSDWSGVPGTLATDWSINGADIMFKYNGSNLNVITDGRFYQGIDIYGASKRVLDEYDISNTTWGNADTVDSYHASDFTRTIYNACSTSDYSTTTCTDLDTWISRLGGSGIISGKSSISTGAWWWIRSIDFQVNNWNIQTSGAMIIYSGDGNSSSKNYKHLLILNAHGDLYGITSNEESWKRYSRFARMDYTNSGSIYADHFYENSDIRYKHNIKSRIIEITDLASLPIFDYTWKDSIEINTGTSAQAVLKILPTLVTEEEHLTLNYSVLGTIAGITACKELVTLKSELLQLKEKVKLLEDKLRKYENTL